MFSHNGRISERQLRRILMLSVFASGVFVIPHLAAKLFGDSVFWGLICFFVLACIYMGCIYKLAHSFHFVECGTKKGLPGKLILAVQSIRQLCRLVFFVLLSVAVLKEAQVPFMKGDASRLNLFVVLPLLLVAAYGAFPGQKEEEKQPYRIEKQGRLYELIFWVLFIPFVVMVLFGVGDIDWRIFAPHMDKSPLTLVLLSCYLLVFLSPVENFLYLAPCLSEKARGKSYYSVMAAVAAIVLLSFAVLGIYGVHGGAEEEMLTISIMRYIKLPLGILGRFDSLLVWFFMTGCFVLISQTMYFASCLLSALLPKGKTVWIIVSILLVALIVPAFLPDYHRVLPAFMRYGVLVDLPLSLLLPGVMWLLQRSDVRRRKRR